MNSIRLKYKNKQWDLLFQPCKYLSGLNYCDKTPYRSLTRCAVDANRFSTNNIFRRYLSNSSSFSRSNSTRLLAGSYANSGGPFRFYSSEGDGRNASEDKHVPLKDVSKTDKGNISKETIKEDVNHPDPHARLGEQDQKEWLINEKLAIESKRKESPFLTKRQRFKNEFQRRIIPWEKQTVSWNTFPYYIHEHSKNLLLECVSSHLKNKKFTTTYGSRLDSSSGRILLQSVPGTELYRERFVRAMAHDLQVPLLVLDSSVLAPYDFGEDNESDDEHEESGEDVTSESDIEDEASNEEEWTSSNESKSDDEDLEARATAALKKLVPGNLEDFAKKIGVVGEIVSESSNQEEAESSEEAKEPLKKGDRVKYVGPTFHVEEDNRPLATGQRGEIYEINGERVAVILDSTEDKTEDAKESEEPEESAKPSIYWIHVKHVEPDFDTEAEDCYIAMEALSELLRKEQPLIVYFPDSSLWLSRAVSKPNRKEFVNRLQEMFDKISGPIVLICGQNKIATGSKEKEKFTMILPNLGRLAKLPLSLKRLTEGLKPSKRTEDNDIYKLFTNVMSLHPPKEEDPLRVFNKQIDEDRRIVISRSNINELHKVLEENELSCVDLLHVNTDGVILTTKKAENVVGWAKNHYLSTCDLPSVKSDRLNLPRESLEVAILRLTEQESISKKPAHNLKNLAKDEYESNFISAVVPPGEIGVKFDDIGALEEVKTALHELAILPMKRPELFSRGNLLRPTKGILLFGPPGTGKTLLAKALATEAGANFISITGSTLTSKWFGDAEKLTKALFSFASKLAPVIVFVDEVDSLLGARGGGFEHEATRRMRNEFMAAWDGLRSKDSQRILILGATNRPFDLDDAVIRRLPRRIYVDLPDADNRSKILKIFLAKENVEPGFDVQSLANATEGYSGSDLKNLCIAAAYRPVQELLDEEKKGKSCDTTPTLRPLSLDDFIQSKAKVGPSVAYDAASMNELRKWNDQYGEGGSRKKSPFGF
ncbi:ATPase, AAA-type, core, P-loop containing nucleoside triphosphate hydrolase [Artemisia annua]|uniref:ATPase, AAA-type, core, P-loop containing nucleoside triphosphate hydrolase n=1 Tax=Artemisia annua TaxID=35608 RepID=A0A2U1Q1A1_ARTAN|nr:ATPase, AAA-type, core, P-loop containing nucleoside triphosphate hydrolase [Artemisia annua]